MATEKKDNAAEEAKEMKNGETEPKEAEGQTEQKLSETAQEKKPEKETEEKPADKKTEIPSEEIQKKAKSKKVEEKPEAPEPDESKSEEPARQDFLSEIRQDLPDLKPGDIIRVYYRVIEGGKERIQAYEGTVIALKNSGISKTVTVRKTSFGIAVERIFPLNSKLIQKIEVKKHSKVRRAKLYYLRKLKGKAARLKELR
jgi:large subunit ribosomal protein L19